MTGKIAIKSLDHIVLSVHSVPKTIEFYTKFLGMRHEVFRARKDSDQERHALLFGTQKINLHSAASPWPPHAANPGSGTADLCLLTDTPVQDALEELKSNGIDILEGGQVVDRTGAVGRLRSIYIRDPDGNLVEISNYV